MICDRCKGQLEVLIYEDSKFIIYEKCFKCGGKGEIDWITEIFQTKQSDVSKYIKEHSFKGLDSMPNSEINLFFSKYPFLYTLKK